VNSLHHTHFDVVIVGAGPAGASCAALLARGGIRVLLCDKAKFPREKICGDCINPKCWNYFDLLGISGEVGVNAQVVKGVKIAGRSGIVLEMPFDSPNLSIRRRRHAASSSQEVSLLIAMKRSILDAILVDRAMKDGATFSDATILESINPDGEKFDRGGWNARFRINEGGDFVNVKCGVLVGADGRNSRVANLLSRDNRDSSKDVISDRIGVQFIVERPTNLESNILMFFFEGGYGGIVGVSAKEANVAMVITQELARLATIDFAQFILRSIHSNEHARTMIPHLELVGEVSTAFPITPRANQLHSSSAYLIGDARHTTEPFTGEGVFFAMQDGLKAARAISKSFGLNSEDEVLNSRNRFWVDNVFSPILQKGTWVEGLLDFGTRHKSLANFVGRRVLG
jgi:flavin-dependent dehydrogenase